MKRLLIVFLFSFIFILKVVPTYSTVINVSLPDTSAEVGEEIRIPIFVDYISIEAFSIDIKYDSTIFKWRGAVRNGTISNSLGLYVQNNEYDIILENGNYSANICRMAAASVNLISGRS